jgi:hypothetical protein
LHLLCALWTKWPRFPLHHWRKDDHVTDNVVPSGSSNGNWANQQKTHRYYSQLQCFLLQIIQRNRFKLGSMDRLRGITVSWRSGSNNLSTWRVYLRLKILTRFDF